MSTAQGCAPAGVMLFLCMVIAGTAAHADPVTVKLASGDVVTGELVSKTETETIIDHPVFGRLVVPASQLEPEKPRQPGIFGTSFLEGWHKELGFGLAGSEGNTSESSGRAHVELSYEDDKLRWNIEGAYKLAQEDGNRTDHFGNLQSRRDWLFEDSRWFAFGSTRYQFDDFEPWRHRLQVGAGPGYHILTEEDLELDGFMGLSATYEFGSVDTLRPEAILGLEFTWTPREGTELSLSNYIFPQLNEPVFRNLSRGVLKLRLAGFKHLSFLIGMDNEYDSAAQEDRNNLKYWSSIGYDF